MLVKIIGIFSIIGAVVLAKHSKFEAYPGDPIGYDDNIEWLFRSHEKRQHKRETNVCETDACKLLGREFKRSMNTSVDPCENFYDYVCGAWNNRTDLIAPYDESYGRVELFQHSTYKQIKRILEQEPSPKDILPIRLAKKWYGTCMDIEGREKRGIKPIESIVMQAGGWPMIMESEEFEEDDFAWQDLEKHYFYVTGKFTFYNVEPSWKRSTAGFEGQIVINDERLPLSLKLPWGFRESESGWDSYKSLVEKVAKVFVKHNKAPVTDDMIEKDVDDLIKFEKELDKITGGDGKSLETTVGEFVSQYNEDVSNLSADNKIHLVQVFTILFNSVNMNIEDDRLIQITNPKYFKRLTKLLDETSKRTIANYIHWRFVSNAMLYTTKEMETIFNEAASTETGVKVPKPRWLECVQDMKFTEAASYTLASQHFDLQTETATTMIDNIRHQIDIRIENSNWMDAELKNMLRDKLNTMKVFLGFPDWYRNETIVKGLYKGLKLGYDYFENMLNYEKYRTRKELLTMKGKPSVEPWETKAMEVNAQYSAENNEIHIPIASLQPPFLTPNLPDVLNYGIIGFTIGHEIGHGYDDRGFDLNKEGKKVNLSKEVTDNYFKQADCFLDQYNDYEGVTEPPNNEDENRRSRKASIGRRTRPENIADTMALSAVFEAWKQAKSIENREEDKLPGFEQYTDEQMFFISYTASVCQIQRPSYLKMMERDEHSLPPVRIKGSFSNTEEFARVFNCPKGSPMNRDHKCDIWTKPEEGNKMPSKRWVHISNKHDSIVWN